MTFLRIFRDKYGCDALRHLVRASASPGTGLVHHVCITGLAGELASVGQMLKIRNEVVLWWTLFVYYLLDLMSGVIPLISR